VAPKANSFAISGKATPVDGQVLTLDITCFSQSFLKCRNSWTRVAAHVDQTDDRKPRLLDICCPDHLAPFIREFDDMFAELLRRACKNRVAKLGNPPFATFPFGDL